MCFWFFSNTGFCYLRVSCALKYLTYLNIIHTFALYTYAFQCIFPSLCFCLFIHIGSCVFLSILCKSIIPYRFTVRTVNYGKPFGNKWPCSCCQFVNRFVVIVSSNCDRGQHLSYALIWIFPNENENDDSIYRVTLVSNTN